ncbi:hypothetical protein CBS101457_004121 [Exobasidium rhododendri]|nr:hypothetical protein CBS101457_004121 [Exobasidium rhododendri]
MPRAEAGSAKAIGNAIKAKGLTKLRFYCQVCEKACRDENGYKCHIESESHMRQIAVLGSNAGKTINNFSQQFQDGFVQLMSRRFGTRRIKANQVYQEYIQDRHHLHMNATKWVSLNEFVKHLGREGIAKVEEIDNEGEHGWYLSWIDNSPGALARQDALQKMERAKVDEEGRMRKYLKDQIDRAQKSDLEKRGIEADEMQTKAQEGLKKDSDANPIKIAFSFNGTSKGSQKANVNAEASTSAAPTAPASAPFKMGSNPFKLKTSAPAKETPKLGGAFKVSPAASSVTATTTSAHSTRPSSMTAAEQIMAEEHERRDKRKLMGPQPSAKRLRM